MAFYSSYGDLTTQVFLTDEDVIRNLSSGVLFTSGSYLGDGKNTNSTTSIANYTAGGASGWKDVQATYNFGCVAIKVDGTLWAWGPNTNGHVGDNTNIGRSSPVQIGTSTDWSHLGFNSGQNYGHCAIKNNGTLWIWGYNGFGSVGDNSILDRSSPTQTVSGGNNWKQATTSSAFTAAVKTDGTLWTWGYGAYGNLGHNDLIDRSSPVQVGSGTDWNQVRTGQYYVIALKTNGTLWTWGQADAGRLGNNDNLTHRSSPVQVGSNTNWKQVATYLSHSVALRTDGTLWVWGNGANGRLGTNDLVSRSTPIQIGSGTDWVKVFAGHPSSYAIKSDGTLWGWGVSTNGALIGSNSGVQKSSPTQLFGGSRGWIVASQSAQNGAAIRIGTIFN